MKRDINKRLRRVLEKQSRDAAASAKYEAASSAPVIQRMRDCLKMRGIEQGPMESLAEAFARVLGISATELRAKMQAAVAAGAMTRTEQIARCHAEIAAIRAEILAGNRDLHGLCLALADWNGELRILREEKKPPGPIPGGEKELREGGQGFNE